MHGQTDRRTDLEGKPDGQTNKKTDRQRNTQTCMQTDKTTIYTVAAMWFQRCIETYLWKWEIITCITIMLEPKISEMQYYLSDLYILHISYVYQNMKVICIVCPTTVRNGDMPFSSPGYLFPTPSNRQTYRIMNYLIILKFDNAIIHTFLAYFFSIQCMFSLHAALICAVVSSTWTCAIIPVSLIGTPLQDRSAQLNGPIIFHPY